MADKSSRKAEYLVVLAEHGTFKAACASTEMTIGQVWEWRETDAQFNDEFKRIWLKDADNRDRK